jgi:hypothetical protein
MRLFFGTIWSLDPGEILAHLIGNLHEHGLVRDEQRHSVNPAGVPVHADVLHQRMDLQQGLHLYSTVQW